MKLLDSICAPGSRLGGGLKTGTGDDRYVFDEAAGWAAVIDGATDVGPVRVYRKAESDAARFAEIFAAQLLAHPPQAGEAAGAYMERFAPRLSEAALAEFRVDPKEAPLSSYPTAAAVWVRVEAGRLEAAALGDSIALLLTPDGRLTVLGAPDKPEQESDRVRGVLARSAEDRLRWLQDTRAVHNTPGAYWVFGVQPEAAKHVMVFAADCPPGSRVLLMSDGFYRLVSPYRRMTDLELMTEAHTRGLSALLEVLRSLEASPADDARFGRIKTSDDATALLFQV
jgi:serine/threonine protein phosphatase PrpC